MSRSKQQIIDTLKANIIAIDPSLDVDKGPIWNIMIQPVSEELYKLELSTDEIIQLLSFDFDNITTESLETLGKNFGVYRKPRTPSRGSVIFYSYSSPTTDIQIPTGTVCSTSDNEILFQTTTMMYLRANTSFYNPVSKRYEILIPVESINSNVESSVPPYRVNTLQIAVNGIDGCNNIKAISGGYDEETDQDYALRIQEALLASLSDSGGWILRQLGDFEDIFTTQLVPSNDPDFELRSIIKPTLDVFIDGDISVDDVFVYTAIGGETQLNLNLVPIMGVNKVLLNGNPITTWEVVKTGILGSLDEVVTVTLGITLNTSDIIEIQYDFNSLVVQAQDAVQDGLFGTDIVVRNMLDYPLSIEIQASVLSAFSSNEIIDNIYIYSQQWVLENLTTRLFSSISLSEYLKSNIPGISSLKSIVFSEDQYYMVNIKKGFKPSITSNSIVVDIYYTNK